MEAIQVNINPESVQAAIVNAILNSAVGEQIQKAINKVLTEKQGSRYDSGTLIENAVESEVTRVVREEIAKSLDSRREEFKAAIAARLTSEMLDKAINKVYENAFRY